MLSSWVQAHNRVPSLGGRQRRRRAVLPSLLTFFMALPQWDSSPSGDILPLIGLHGPDISLCTSPWTAIQEPLLESNQRAQGIAETLSTEADRISNKFTSFLTSHEQFLPSALQGLHYVMTKCCRICGWIFRHCIPCPMDHALHQSF